MFSQTLIYIFGDMLNSVGAAGKVFEYLDRRAEISMDGKLQPEKLTGQISFQNITFSYPTRPDHNVLEVHMATFIFIFIFLNNRDSAH